ncbi:MAG: hypothetical protein A2Z14_08280 [Chloroflexi bacterium RBG_16_48_8]|nr:MAG: hypothetical protein A2Z14_08280 [Chloroflexi bacterium RBG_16_48_8]
MNDTDQGNQVVDHDVMVFKRSYVYAILLPLTFLLGLSSGYLLWGRESVIPTNEPTPMTDSLVQTTPQRFDVSVDDDPYLGPEDAPVVIIEFSDFNCGYCSKWYRESLQPILDQYPEQIRFVYRDFPMLSESSVTAAQAAQCAHEQNAFWDFHNAFFTRDEPRSMDTYLLLAKEFNLNVEDFQECYESDRTMEEIENDARFAASVGIRVTPTFFIKGIQLVEAQR